MIRKKDLKEDIDNLRSKIYHLQDRNAKVEQKLTMPLTEYSEIAIKQVVCALLRFLELEIATVKPNEHFELKPIKQKKGK